MKSENIVMFFFPKFLTFTAEATVDEIGAEKVLIRLDIKLYPFPYKREMIKKIKLRGSLVHFTV